MNLKETKAEVWWCLEKRCWPIWCNAGNGCCKTPQKQNRGISPSFAPLGWVRPIKQRNNTSEMEIFTNHLRFQFNMQWLTGGVMINHTQL